MKKYPKTLYVQLPNEGTNDEYFNTERSVESIDDDGQVAVYELKLIKTRRTEVHLE
jgi:hypothetical protein